MSYLLYVAFFGAAVVIFLWLRDARIFFRTGLSGYRKAAYWGVLYGALGTFGVLCTLAGESIEIFGLALILAALYLQGRMTREKIWTGKESTLGRTLGSVKRPVSDKK
ncbi:ABC transporter permease [Methanoregula sp.]|uniref:ABC transporter permease n=1 Tax=Methanoregula sp. TaxID=2052170 RepID=UPI00356B498D